MTTKFLDIKEYKSLFNSFYLLLVQFAMTFIQSVQIAEDIVQDVFIYLWEKRAQITIHTSMKSYLYSATKNACINYIKSKHFQQESKHVEIPEYLPENIWANTRLEEEEVRQQIENAINDLPEKCRIIYSMCKHQDMSYKDVAETLEISIKTVENQMSIALRRLRENLRVQ